ncbi:MAG: hypothetical protein OET90_04850 [Desulfuromonadales bacterium]|nr:hypothetical protein [Desulfuromonadales bacterium]
MIGKLLADLRTLWQNSPITCCAILMSIIAPMIGFINNPRPDPPGFESTKDSPPVTGTTPSTPPTPLETPFVTPHSFLGSQQETNNHRRPNSQDKETKDIVIDTPYENESSSHSNKQPEPIVKDSSLTQDLLHQADIIESCKQHNNNLGDGYQDKLSKRGCLQKILSAANVIKRHSYDLRMLVSSPEVINYILQHTNYIEFYETELQELNGDIKDHR